MKLKLAIFLLFLFFCGSPIILLAQKVPSTIKYCSFPQFKRKSNDPACIQYQAQVVKDDDPKHPYTFINAPQGDFTKAIPSWYLTFVDSNGARLAVAIGEGRFIVSTETTNFYAHVIEKPFTLRFMGWDGKKYEISFSELVPDYGNRNKLSKVTPAASKKMATTSVKKTTTTK